MDKYEYSVSGAIAVITVECPFCGNDMHYLRMGCENDVPVRCCECNKTTSSMYEWPNEEEFHVFVSIGVGDEVDVLRIEEIYD